MQPLNIETRNGKDYIFCPYRHKWVRLTPEEEVRQRFLHYMVDRYRYPASRLALEAVLPSGQRADTVVYDNQLKPVILIEFKAPSVAITAQTLDQAAVYNRMLHVPLLILHNGNQTFVAKVGNNQIEFLSDLPVYGQDN